MAPLIISRATVADVPAMAALRAASGWAGGANATVMARYIAGEHHPRGALPPRAVWQAHRGEQLVGFLAGHRTTRADADAELQWLLVAPEARGQGVGHALVSEFARWCVAAGARRVLVNVAPENEAARRLYATHGAEAIDTYWMVWPDIGARPLPDRNPGSGI